MFVCSTLMQCGIASAACLKGALCSFGRNLRKKFDLRNVYFFHTQTDDLFSVGKKVLGTLFEARKLAGSAKCK